LKRTDLITSIDSTHWDPFQHLRVLDQVRGFAMPLAGTPLPVPHQLAQAGKFRTYTGIFVVFFGPGDPVCITIIF